MLLLVLIFSTFSLVWVIFTQFGKSDPHTKELSLFFSFPDHVDC